MAVAQPGLVPVAVADPDGPGVSGDLTTGVRDRGETLADLVARYESELASYQDQRYALHYVEDVLGVASAIEDRLGEGGLALATAYADGLFKLMAYKDEYEVARLHLDLIERARLQAEFGGDARVKVLLHPPVLRALGMKRKLALGRSARPLFRALQASRRLRGTSFDPFGHSKMRRTERALIAEYRQLVKAAVDRLVPSTASIVLEMIQLPDMVRGYEGIKLRNVERMRERASELLAALTGTGSAAGREADSTTKAGDGNRTRPRSLEGFGATTTLRPQ